MDTIKLLLAHSDRAINNAVEIAVLDVCYDLAVVETTRVTRLDELVRQGGLWEFDLIVVGTDKLFVDRAKQTWAEAQDVAEGILTIKSQSSTPIVALVATDAAREAMLKAGADRVVTLPLKVEQLKAEVKPLLKLGELVEVDEPRSWSGIGSLLRGFHRAKAVE